LYAQFLGKLFKARFSFRFDCFSFHFARALCVSVCVCVAGGKWNSYSMRSTGAAHVRSPRLFTHFWERTFHKMFTFHFLALPTLLLSGSLTWPSLHLWLCNWLCALSLLSAFACALCLCGYGAVQNRRRQDVYA